MTQPTPYDYPGWSVRAQLMYRRTYARPLNPEGTVFENWPDTVNRVMAHQQWLWERAQGHPLDEAQLQEIEELSALMLDRKVFLAGRTLWLGGTPISREREVSQFNCAGEEVETVYDVVDFLWCLLNGAGVGGKPREGVLNGFSQPLKELEVIRSQYTVAEFLAGRKGSPDNYESWDPASKTWTIQVGDSSEAWAKALGKLLAGKYPADKLVLDFSQIRAEGTRLSNYGWICSGDEKISKAMAAIADILSRRAGTLLSKIDILDILNWLGTSLSSRRSAQIMLFDYGDSEWEEFALAKKDYFLRGNDHRAQSNNSLVFWNKPERHELERLFRMMQEAGGSEPGFINGAEARRRAPWFRVVNPCFAGSQRLLLPTGYVTMKEAYEQQGRAQFGDVYSNIQVVNRNGVVPATQVYKTGSDVEVFDVVLRSGKRIRATSNHAFILTNEQRVQLKDLEVGDEVFVNQQRHFGTQHQPAYALLAGLFIGDGSFSGFSGDTAKLRVWNDDIELVGPSIEANARHYYEVERAGLLSAHSQHQKNKFDLTPRYREKFGYTQAEFTSQVLANQLIADGVVVGDKHRVPASIWCSDAETVSRFLCGLFSADGHFQYSAAKQCGSVVLTQVHRPLLEEVQLLLEQLGILSRIYPCQSERLSTLNDGAGGKKDYLSQQSWRLMIMNRESISRFYDQVGFVQSTKHQQVLDYLTRHKGSRNSGNRYRDEVVSVEYAGREDTYCLTEAVSNEVVVNGIVIGQCAEILLASKSFCNLVEVDLAKFRHSTAALLRAITLVARANYRQTCVNLKDPILQEAWHLNNQFLRLCGVGLTGIALRPDLQAYHYREMERTATAAAYGMADELNLPRPKNVCTIKPSGCQKPDTMLITDSGVLRLDELGDVNGAQWQEHSLAVASQNSVERSTKFYVNGRQQTVRLRMQSGLELEATPNHQFKVLRDGVLDWVRSDNIAVGDLLPYSVGGYTSTAAPLPLKAVDPTLWGTEKCMQCPTELDADLAWFLGLYYGDGSNHKRGIRIAGNVKDTRDLKRAARIVKDKFGLDAKLYLRISQQGSADLYVYSAKQLTAWLGANGLLKNKSHDVGIPAVVRRSSAAVLRAFIDGYFAAGGHLSQDHRCYVTVSRRMAEELIVCLRALGTDAGMRHMPPTKTSFGKRMRYYVQERKGRTGQIHSSCYWKGFKELNAAGLDYLNPDYVVEISRGESDTYDIEVPSNNTYLANSYISHNTLSKVADSTEGIHKPLGKYIFNRVIFAKDDPLVERLREAGYQIEPHPASKSEMLAVFPVAFEGVEFDQVWRDGKLLEVNLEPAVSQLERYRMLQQNWTHHNTSITVSYDPEEVPEIVDWITTHWDSYVGVSFIYRDDPTKTARDLGYPYLPQTVVSQEDYEEYISRLRPVTVDTVSSLAPLLEDECATGVCPTR